MLRIIGGTLRGKSLKIPPSSSTRPTSDRGREAIFNILAHQFIRTDGISILQNAYVMDFFAGSGAFGIEILSRGASFCVFVENDLKTLPILEQNLSHLKLIKKSFVIKEDLRYSFDLPIHLKTREVDIVFLDPPYGKGFIKNVLMILMKKNYLSLHTLIIAEMEKSEDISFIEQNFLLKNHRVYGKSQFLFFKLKN